MKYPFSSEPLPLDAPLVPILSFSINGQTIVRRTRYKLWELQSCWHCMVVGTCLTLAEVRQSAQKAALAVTHKSDYDIHQLAVECAADKLHPLTQRLQKLLERKYALQVKRFRTAKNSEEITVLWDSGWKSGQVGGSLWALITHHSATREIVLEVFGQVHMMSHLSGASTCADRGRLKEQERQLEVLTNELETVRCRYAQTSQSLTEQARLVDAERANWQRLKTLSQQAEKHQLMAVHPSISKLTASNELIDQLRGKISDLQQCVGQEKALNQSQKHDIDRLERLLAANLKEEQSESTAALKLCGQCVLYLGGKAQQRRHFQEYVESCEGRFLHHDGGRETCPHRISELVSQADVVMCPTDCVSHGAMEKARALCAKQNKPIVFMQRASLSTFTRSLQKTFG
ncbi:MAG: hypothetical protein ACI9UN_004974 [Granulosicoccus sp.]